MAAFISVNVTAVPWVKRLSEASGAGELGGVGVTYQGSVYEPPRSVFNALVQQQAAERMAAGHKYPAIVEIPRSLLRRT